jgi:class 3 adenylate cyclase
VAGYTALSSHDEDLALAVIKGFQRISKQIVGDKGGRVVKFLGDGMLAEFSSLDAAVNSAHALQHSFSTLKDVKESRVSLRVGVHLGDIVFGEDGDVYGSGVNVASRIESHAPLAGVVVSESAYQQLRHRKHYQFSSIGEKDLKGVPEIRWSCLSCSWPVKTRPWHLCSSPYPGPQGLEIGVHGGRGPRWVLRSWPG